MLCPPMLVQHCDDAPRRQNRTLLPGADMAQMLAGKIEGAARLAEHRIVRVMVDLVARGVTTAAPAPNPLPPLPGTGGRAGGGRHDRLTTSAIPRAIATNSLGIM